MEAYVRGRSGITLRRIDIVSWDSAVAKQYQIRSIPYLILYENGRKTADGTKAVLALLK